MANDKNFVVKNGLTAQEVKFVDATNTTSPTNTITASMLTSGTLSFSGSSGQLFSITDDLSGTIFAVNDVSGIPAIEVDDDGTIRFAESFGNVLIGTNVDDGTNKLQVTGNMAITGDILNGGDGNRIRFMYGTTNSQPSIGVGEQGTYGFAMRWDAGSELDFDGWWNSSVTGAANRDLGSVNVDTRVWNFHNDVQVNGNSVLTTASTISSATNADTVDSLHASSFIRSDANDSFSGAITGAGSIDITGNIGGAVVSADTRFETTYNTNDGTVKMLGYGLEMSRASSYIRPTADNTQTLYIGGADATLDWNTVDIKASSTIIHGDVYIQDDGGPATNATLQIGVSDDFAENSYATLHVAGKTNTAGQQAGDVKIAVTDYDNDGASAVTTFRTVNENGIIEVEFKGSYSNEGTEPGIAYFRDLVGIGQTDPRVKLGIGQQHDSPNEQDRILNWYATTGGTEIHNDNIGLSYVNNNNSTDQPRAIGVALANKSSTDQVWSPAITFGAESTSGNYMTGSAAIAAQNFANGDANFRGGDLHFFTSGVTNSSPDTRGLVSRMVIDNEGHVGIGTVSPVDPFEVHGTAGQLFAVTDDLTGTIFSVNDVSGVPSIEVEDSGDIKLARFAGAVLVGTGTSTGAKLDVVGNATIDGLLSVSNDVTGERFNSTVADGTTPFSVNSTTTVTNLSADYVDGLHASQFLRSDATDTASGQLTFTNKVIIDHNTNTMLQIQATNGSPWAIDLGRDDATNSKVFNGGGYWSFEHLPRWHNSGGSQILSLAHSKDIARSLGWVPGYNNSDEYSVLWNNTEDAVELYSGTDTGIGAIHQAVFIPSGQKVRFSVMVKGSASATSGLYLRLYAYNGTSLPNGKTHVSNDTAGGSSVLVQEDSSGDNGWTENQAVPATWTTYSREYTAAQDVMVSLVVLNWSGFSGSLYIKQPTIDIVKVADAEKLDGVNGASYLRSDAADSWSGLLSWGGSGGTTALQLNNADIVGVNWLHINDEGEGIYFGGQSTGPTLFKTAGSNQLETSASFKLQGQLEVASNSSNRAVFKLGTRGADPAPAGSGSYSFIPAQRTGAFEPPNGAVNGDSELPLVWYANSYDTGSNGYLAASQTYATASWSQTFTVNQASGTRWFVKIKTNDAESGNDPRVAVNGGTEYKLEYADAENGGGEDDTDAWHVIDITDDVVDSTNTIKIWLAAGQKTYVLAVIVFPSVGIALPNEPYETRLAAMNGIRIHMPEAGDMDAIQFYEGDTRMGEIGTNNTTWFRINQNTAKNIYTPRYIRADGGIHVDSTDYGFNGSGRLLNASFSGTYSNQITLSNDSGLNIYTATNGAGAQINFSDNTGNSWAQNGTIKYLHSDNAITTGSNDGFHFSGTEASTFFRFDGKMVANGSLLVGSNNAPRKTLDVDDGATGGQFAASFGGAISSGNWKGIHFGYMEVANDSYRKSALIFERQDSAARGKIHILNNGDNNSNSATLADAHVTIQYDGNVGIGVTSPTNKFEVSGTNGQLFAVADDMTGTIFSVNDASGVPSIEVDDTGVVRLAEFVGNVLVGTGTDDGTNKLQVNGSIRAIQSSGDGGFVLREWPGNSTYASLQTNGMANEEYVVISNGTDTYVGSGSGGATTIRSNANDSSPQLVVQSDRVKVENGDLYIGDGTDNSRILIQKLDNNVSDHIIFYNTTTRMGEIGCHGTTWLRINQSTSKNIYTPRYIRSDGGFYVDSTSYGINGSGRLLSASFSGTYSNSIAFSNSYNSFGNDAGNTTYNNTGSWNGRLNVIGTQHARLDVVSASDGIITTMYAHTGHGTGKVGTMSNHPLTLMVNGANIVTVSSSDMQLTGSFTASGNVTAYSDARLKDNVQTVSGIEKVSQMRGVTYERNDMGGQKGSGVIAQELQKVAPELVKENADGMMGVDYNGIIAYLIESIKDLKEEIEELKNK